MEEIMAKRKSKPIVAVVGRPNVGKSTLFNALAGENISIVKDTPGITRDRIYADIHWLDMTFTLIDTGGIEPDSKDVILSQMREQAAPFPQAGGTGCQQGGQFPEVYGGCLRILQSGHRRSTSDLCGEPSGNR